MTTPSGAYVVKTEDEEDWWWECQVCGWTGWDLHSSDRAVREAERHQRTEHSPQKADSEAPR
jgi:hypothetical protein